VNYLADLRGFLRWSETTKGAESSPLSLETADIREYCSFLQQTRNHTPATVNRRIQALRKFYDFTTAQGWTRANPAEGVPLVGKTTSVRSKTLTPEEVSRLLAAVHNSCHRWVVRDWAIMQVLLGAGLKLGEMIQLRLSDFHPDSDRPHLSVRGKSGEPGRAVPLEAEVEVALKRYLVVRRAVPGVDALFVNRNGQPLSTRSIQRLLSRYARAAGLNGLTTQALRYVYATKVYQDSGDLKAVARLLGHRHLATTVRYLGLEDQAPNGNKKG